MSATALVHEWLQYCQGQDVDQIDKITRLLELIDEEFQPKRTTEELIESLTVEEVIQQWMNVEDKWAICVRLSELVQYYYFKDNPVLEAAVAEVEQLENQYNHRCIMTMGIKLALKQTIIPPDQIQDIIHAVRQHILEAENGE